MKKIIPFKCLAQSRLFVCISFSLLSSSALYSNLSDGSILWNRTYGGTGNDVPYAAVAASTSDGFLLLGESDSPTKSGSTPYPGSTLALNLVDLDGDGDLDMLAENNADQFVMNTNLVSKFSSFRILYPSGVFKSEPSPGGNDYWAVRIDEDGNQLWDRTIGGSGSDIPYSAVATSDGGFLLLGQSASGADANKSEAARGWDYWAVRIDSSGNILWDRAYGGSGYDKAYSAVSTSDGGFLLLGESSSGADGNKSESSRGSYDFWAVRIDALGNQIWDHTYGGSGSDIPNSTVLTSDGGFLLVGRSSSQANGDKSESSRGNDDFWAVRIDSSGNKLWDRTYGGSENDYAYDAVETSDGGFLLAGESNSNVSGEKSEPSLGNFDSWIIRIDSNGNKLWDRTYGDTGYDEFFAMTPAPDEGFFLLGYSDSPTGGDKSEPSIGGYDYWAVRIDASGNKLWDRTYGGSNSEVPHASVATSNGNYLVVGESDSMADGNKSDLSLGGRDFWVLEIKENVKLSTSSPGTKLWEFETTGVTRSLAVGADGTVYLGSDDQKLYAVNGQSGEKTWEYKAESNVYSPVMGADGTVYLGSEDKKLHAVNGTTGAKLWEFQTEGAIYSSPAVATDGSVYVGSSDSKLYSLNGSTGEKIWDFQTGGSLVSSPALATDGTIYLGSVDGKLYALDGSSGLKIWEFQTGGSIYSSPAIGADGTVYFGSNDYKLYALNGSSGAKLWDFQTGGFVTSSPAIASNGTVYFGSVDKKLYALNGATGAKLWDFQTEGFVTSSPAIASDGTVYFGSSDSKLYSLNGSTGEKIWDFQTGGNIQLQNSPSIGEDGTIYIGSGDKKLYAVKGSAGPATDAPWPMFGQNPQRTGRVKISDSSASANSQVNSVLENGLVARYSFDGNFSDGSGGTDQGSTSQVAYYPGKTPSDLAIRSMGSDSLQSYFISSMIRAYAASNPRALSIWFRATAFPGNTGSWGKSNLGQIVLPSRVVAPLRMLSDNTIGWDTGDGVRFFSLPTGSQIADGEWHHLVASYGGSILDGEGAIYFDGQKLTGGNTMWGNQSSYAFESGPIINGGGDQGLVAYDDIRIYDRALTEVEVGQIRQTELPTTKLTEETSFEQVLTASDGFDSMSDPGSAVTLSGGAEIQTGEKLPDQSSNIRIKANLAFAYQKGNALLRKHYKLGNFNMRYKAHVYGAGTAGGGAMGTYLQYASNPDRRLNFRLLSEENGQPTSKAELRIEKENDGVEVLKSVDLSTILWNQKLASSTSEHWPVSVRMKYLNKKLTFYLNGIKAMEYAIDLVAQGVLTSDGFGQVGFSGETGKNPVSQEISDWTLQSEPGTYTGVAQQVTLSLSANTGGSVSGGGIYTVDSNVTIQATANNGYKFIGWSGAEVEVSTNTQTNVMVQADTSIQASFEYIGQWADGSAKGTDSLFRNATRTVALNWWYSPWFGYFWHKPNKDWIYHSTLGWIYFYPIDSSSSWAYIQGLNGRPYWLWLHRDHFPFAYSQLSYERVDSKGHWLYFDLLRKHMRLWKESEGQWTEETKLQNSDSKEQEELEPAITSNTYIKIFFDSSGSMNSTLSKLNEMVDGEYSNPNSLRSILQDFYATGAKESEGNFDTATNGSDRFGERVKIVSNNTERTFAKLLNSGAETQSESLGFGTGPNDPFPDASNVVVIVFQDESDGAYYREMFYNNDKEIEYELDIKAFREGVNELNILNPSFYRGIIMQVQYVNQEFKEFLGAVVQGTGSYTGEFGLSDSPFTEYLNVVNDLEDGSSTQSYYRDFVGQALIDLGFKINL